MSPDRWERVAEVFHGALALTASERDRFLATACGDDAELRGEVTALLSGHQTGPLDALGLELPRQIQAALPGDPMPGARIGPYRLVDRLGRGGMGVVYLAERDDPEMPQRVALKLLRGGFDAGEPIGRFLTERRILLRLEHPNITRLLDGGVTPEGLPYFAMEHVDGRPIDRYCDGERLTVRERLDLFLAACDAMQYAHRHLVVHRDVKPSNILVTREGAVKVLDFGIAKLLDDQETAAGQTRTAHRWLTPEYASPEQVRGEPVTTASDVYGLGVVLYELLTGRRPYDVEARSRHDIERAVLESEPLKPSVAALRAPTESRPATEAPASTRGVPPARLRRQLAGDLDTIVLKALQKEPGRRYHTAGELAEDVRRHLTGLPVLARPDTLRYRAGKFIRRHRVGVAAAVLVAGALLAGAAGTLTQARRATAQARVAADEAAKAGQVSEFLIDLFEAADPSAALGREVTARELLERGAARLREDSALAAQPSVRAEFLDVLGEIYVNLGWRTEARGLLEEALALRRRNLAPADPAFVESLLRLGELEIYDGRPAAAQGLYEEALDALRAAPDSVARPDVASALVGLAAVHRAYAAYDTAEALLRRAVALRRGHEDEALVLAGNLNGLAVVLSDNGKLAAADSAYADVLAIQRERLDPLHPDLARTLNNIATLRYQRGDAAGAEAYFREALDIWREVLGRHPDVAVALNNLAASLERQGKYHEAEAAYRESLALKRELVAGDHPTISSSLNNLGLMLTRLSRYDEAEPLLTESLAMRRRLHGDDHPAVARAYHNLADLHERRGQLARAEAGYEQALDIRRDRLGPAHRQTLDSALALARVRHARGDAAGAATILDWLIEVGAPALPAGDSLLADARRLQEALTGPRTD